MILNRNITSMLVTFAAMTSGCDQFVEKHHDLNVNLSGIVAIFPDGGSRLAEGNRWEALVRADGHWAAFQNESSSSKYPANGSVSSIKSGGLWITANFEGKVYDACAYEYGSDFTPGRIINQNLPVEELIAASPDSFPVFMLSTDPDKNDEAFWPTQYGAPSKDNKPIRTSNTDTWSVFHDLNSASLSGEPGKSPMGIEVQMTTWMFDDYIYKNVLFVRYRVFNRSNRTYTNVRIATWLTQGDYWNDENYIASDSIKGSTYIYKYGSRGPNRTLGIQMIGPSGVPLNNHYIGNTNYQSGILLPSKQIERYYISNGLRKNGDIEGNLYFGWYNPGDPRYRTYLVGPFPDKDGVLVAAFHPVELLPNQSTDAVFAIYGFSDNYAWYSAIEDHLSTSHLINISSEELYTLP